VGQAQPVLLAKVFDADGDGHADEREKGRAGQVQLLKNSNGLRISSAAWAPIAEELESIPHFLVR
jgi:hypothetical protein